jgi:hypothetical protein
VKVLAVKYKKSIKIVGNTIVMINNIINFILRRPSGNGQISLLKKGVCHYPTSKYLMQ